MYDREEVGANVPHDLLASIKGAAEGPLKGLTFMVKDLFQVKGHKTGNGSPDFLQHNEESKKTAPLIQSLLDNGATLTGVTICDEFFYSLTGINAHYGSPLNVRAKGRMAGGSSSGSAASVAASLCDFSIGSDTGGSVRVPAAFCGLYGIRPTHAEIDLTGATAMAPSFDTPGWFTRDADLLKKIGDVLLPKQKQDISKFKLHIAIDTFEQATEGVRTNLISVCDLLEKEIPTGNSIRINNDDYFNWREAFRIIQAYEIKNTTLKWVKTYQPDLGPGIKERFQMADKVSDEEFQNANKVRQAVRDRMEQILDENSVLLMPTAPVIAPLISTKVNELESFRQNTMALTCISGLTGMPQITLPVAEVLECPVGLSILGKKYSDKQLLELSCTISKRLNLISRS